jgi:DNA mismatch repair protein MutL
MAKIKRLSKDVIGQIAAGEVVERPMAAIKEMVENAIDAEAKAISVEIKGGGIDSIRVSDNGSGIAEEDLALVFERHATSKLSTAQQLSHINTLGFRGEALSSIAAVGRVRLIHPPGPYGTGRGSQERGRRNLGHPPQSHGKRHHHFGGGFIF